MRIILILLTALIILSCKEDVKMVSEKKIVFQLGYQPVSYLSGFFNDKKLIYFADPATTKQIKFFDLKGNLKDSISLKAIVDQYSEITDIKIFSLDTIIVTSQYINLISVLNSHGEIWKQLNLNDRVIDSEQNKYWLRSSFIPSYQEKNKMLYHSEWRSNLIDKVKEDIPNNSEEYIEYFAKKTYDSHVLVQINDLFSDKPTLSFGLKNFHHEIKDVPHYVLAGTKFTLAKDNIYVFRYFSDHIFIVDPKNLKLVNKIKLTSNFTTIGMDPPVTQEDFDYLKTISRKKGTIQRLLYNNYEDEFYVILTKDIEKEEEEGPFRPFIVQCYDENFMLKSEKEFSAGKYCSYLSYVVEGNLMIYKKNNNINSLKNGEQIFEFFTFN